MVCCGELPLVGSGACRLQGFDEWAGDPMTILEPSLLVYVLVCVYIYICACMSIFFSLTSCAHPLRREQIRATGT